MINSLKEIGLSDYESKCYLALLNKGDMKGNDVALEAKIPRTSVYPTLERLESKKFIYKIKENPKIYRALKPSIAINSFIERKKLELEQISEKAIKDLSPIKKRLEEDHVKIYFGKEQSYKAGKENHNNIEKELLIFTNGFDKNSILNHYTSWKKLLNKKVKIYVIIPHKRKNEKAFELILELKKLGMNIAFYDLNNLSFTVSDRKRASVGIKNEQFEGGRITVSFYHKDFANHQANFFFSIWKKAEKIK